MKTFFACNPLKKATITAAIIVLTSAFAAAVSAQGYYPAGLGNTNLSLWLTAADSTTLRTAAGTQAVNGNAVAKWMDKSGKAAHAVQATGAAQPVYSSNAKNGLGGLVFQNTSQYLTGPTGSYQTIVSARSMAGTGGSAYHYLFSAPANSDFSVRNSGGGSGSNAVSYTDGPNVNDWCYNTGTTPTQWVNGTQALVGSTTNHILVDASAAVTNATYSVSSAFMSRGMYGNDPVYELIAYNSTLSVTMRRLLENYEAAEWGMTASLPATGYTKFTAPTASTYNKNLVGIGYTSSSDNFLANPAGATDGLGFSSTSTATGFLNTPGFIMAAHNGQANTVTNNAAVPGIGGSNITAWTRSWYLQKTGGNNAGQLTLTFNFTDYNGSTPNAVANFGIVYNASNGGFTSGTNSLIHAVSTTISANSVSFVVNAASLANGYYSLLYSTSSTLPVDFTGFTAARSNEGCLLQWSVADQTGSVSYAVQRSVDGYNFTTIGMVNTTAITATANYSFTDTKPSAGTNYYRIKLTEAGGRILYSVVKSLNVGNNQLVAVAVYPNPASTVIHVNAGYNLPGAKPGHARILNIGGQSVTANISLPLAGTIDIPVNQLSKGIYFLEATTGNGISITKIMKD